MRPICDVCEASPAKVFCAADEAALCLKCDEKVHGCNKLASRHIRLVLAETSVIRRCDICENAPAFFFCGIDGTSLCLQCDMEVHVGGKRTHERYLLMGQRVEFPTASSDGNNKPVGEMAIEGGGPRTLMEKNEHENNPSTHERVEHSGTSAIAVAIKNTASQMFDLNFCPHHDTTATTTSSIRDVELRDREAAAGDGFRLRKDASNTR